MELELGCRTCEGPSDEEGLQRSKSVSVSLQVELLPCNGTLHGDPLVRGFGGAGHLVGDEG